MSEYGRRIAAYGALAVVIGTALSLGVVLLPSHLGLSNTSSTTSSGTEASCVNCYALTSTAGVPCTVNESTGICGTELEPSTENETTFFTASESSNTNCSSMAGTNITLCHTTSALYSSSTVVYSSVSSCESNACVGSWSAEFNVTIVYKGNWNASYIGYDTNVQNESGVLGGTGTDSTAITLNAYGDASPTLCATASKLDSTNATLVVSVNTNNNSTSASYGTATACYTVHI